MTQARVSVLADFIVPPRAGQISVLAVTSSAASQDLRLLGNQTGNMGAANTQTTGAPGHYVTFLADTEDVYVNFGVSQAAVTTANAPVIATTGVNAASACFRIVKDTQLQVFLEAGVDNFIGYIGAGNGNLRVFISSPCI